MRASGILMGISSIPSKYGIGCFSKEAYEFVFANIKYVKVDGNDYLEKDKYMFAYYLDENKKLVEFLKEGMKNNKYEVLLHGINHEYKLEDNEWIPEMMFK